MTNVKQKLTEMVEQLRSTPVKEKLHQAGESIEKLEVKQKLSEIQARWDASPVKAKVGELGDEVNRAFTTHPKSIGETYLQHLWFTTKMAVRLVASGIALLLHGLFPFLFTRTASNEFDAIYAIMKKRITPTALLSTYEQQHGRDA
jgi:hypothetical protein